LLADNALKRWSSFDRHLRSSGCDMSSA
jgi:hypothetical protein